MAAARPGRRARGAGLRATRGAACDVEPRHPRGGASPASPVSAADARWLAQRTVVTEHVLQGLDRVRPTFEHSELPDPLTRREREVLRLMAGGYSNREIADTLGSSEGTVKNHAASIFSKLGVRDRTRAVLKALGLGYL